MDYRQLDIQKIKYIKNNLYYNNQRVIINIPCMLCKGGITQQYNKYQIKLEINSEDFYNFLKLLEEQNKKHCSKSAGYKSNIIKENNRYYLIIKVPYRYKKIEIDIHSDKIYLPTIADIKDNTKLKCNICIPKIWNFQSDDGHFMSGTIMEVKDITIM